MAIEIATVAETKDPSPVVVRKKVPRTTEGQKAASSSDGRLLKPVLLSDAARNEM